MGVSLHRPHLITGSLFLSGTILLLICNSTARLRFSSSEASSKDIGGLLAPRPNGDECVSRLQHHLYYGRGAEDRPSSYFISKLRQYEKLHQRCAKEAHRFSANSSAASSSDCQFVVWISYQGLGNKMLTLASAFLYALLTGRVLLVDRGTDMPELFCEPFPDTSWFLPVDFPHDYLHSLNRESPNKLGRLLEAENCDASNSFNSFPSVVYVHIALDATGLDQRFYCKREQDLLRRQTQWLLLRADVYYVPHLYFISEFREEFLRMFPEQDKVFHYTARYLFHPSNTIWQKTMRFYETYLAEADVLIGYQIRPVDTSKKMLDRYWHQAVNCGLQKGILPNVTDESSSNLREFVARKPTRKQKVKVLVVSLHQRYYDSFKDFYLQHGLQEQNRSVEIHFASHEGHQQTDDLGHDQKAVMEVFLLAMSDVLVTTARSTYGYIAHGYGGIRPWTIRGAFDDTEAGTGSPCFRMSTVDPCFLRYPLYDCDCKGNRPLPRGVKQCQDFPIGLRLFSERGMLFANRV